MSLSFASIPWLKLRWLRALPAARLAAPRHARGVEWRPGKQVGARSVGVLLLVLPALAAEPRPNVLMIAVDDMRDWVGHLGGYGGKVYTPHLDRLAREGVAFKNAHCPSPVCNPSRAAVMTGRMPSQTGIYDNSQWLAPNRYPGVELLSDGMTVAMTYLKYREGPEKNSAVRTRFTVAETDKLAVSN